MINISTVAVPGAGVIGASWASLFLAAQHDDLIVGFLQGRHKLDSDRAHDV